LLFLEDWGTPADVDIVDLGGSLRIEVGIIGVSYPLANGAVFKMDYQSKGTVVDYNKGQFNMGLGVFF